MSTPNYGAAVTPTDPYPLPPVVAPGQQTAPGQQAAPSAKDRAADVAQTGKQAAGDVAQTATGAAKDVAHETHRQASDLVDKTRTQLSEQAAAQKHTLVDNLRSVHEQLESMTRNTSSEGVAVDLVDRARRQTQSAADWLERREPNEVVDELRTLGRRQPGQFLVGAVLAGIAAGRLTRGTVAVHTDSEPSHDSAATVSPQPRHSAPRPTPNGGLPLVGEAPGAVPENGYRSEGYPAEGFQSAGLQSDGYQSDGYQSGAYPADTTTPRGTVQP